MAIHFTPNLQLPYPDGTELVSLGPEDFQNIASALDAGTAGPTTVRVTVGLLAARPAASTVPVGSLYHASDAGALAYSDGSAWHPVAFNTMGPPVGSMQQYAGANDPADPDGVVRWVICDGRALSRTAYAALFGAIGTTYGAGDGSTTFNIPNLQGQVPVGAGTPPVGGGTFSLGQNGGEVAHTLVLGEIPSHDHGVSDPGHSHGVGDPGHAHGFGWNVPAASVGWGFWEQSYPSGSQIYTPYRAVGTSSQTNLTGTEGATTGIGIASATTGVTTDNAGGGGAHNNMQPYLVVNHIIRVL